MNTLYYGDDLKILRDHIKDESVDLIYLDPTSPTVTNIKAWGRVSGANGTLGLDAILNTRR